MEFNSQRLREARLHAGLTHEALARRAGTSVRNIFRWESGAHQPRVEAVASLARALNVDVSYLLRDEEKEQEESEDELEAELLAVLRRWLMKRQTRKGKVAA